LTRDIQARRNWLNRFGELLVGYEKKAANYVGLLHFAWAHILWHQLIPDNIKIIIFIPPYPIRKYEFPCGYSDILYISP
jgi:hypothetical protein